MATAGEPSENPSTSDDQNGTASEKGGNFDCNICFDIAKDAVISMCGHLFCWPCIYQWMESRGQGVTCPVCKAAIDKDKLIPLYGRGNQAGVDPRNTAPPRPPGQREEPAPNHPGGDQWGFQDGIQFSFGIGAFPFMMFGGPFFQMFGLNQPMNMQRRPQQTRQEQILSRIMMLVSVLIILWLIFS